MAALQLKQVHDDGEEPTPHSAGGLRGPWRFFSGGAWELVMVLLG